MIQAHAKALEAGVVKAEAMIMVGAASKYIPLFETFSPERIISDLFRSRGEPMVAINQTAFRIGRILC